MSDVQPIVIRVVSDVHTEFNHFRPDGKYLNLPPNDCDILIIAGDVGQADDQGRDGTDRYIEFLKQLSEYKKVIIIAGNHEYYNGRKPHIVDEAIREIISGFPNIVFLQKDSVVISGIRFLGCTLWSKPDPVLFRSFSDKRDIQFSCEEYDNLHTDHLAWLESQLTDELLHIPTVVITHHLPTYKLVGEKFKGSPYNCFFASECDHLVSRANYWFCGHTHTFADKTIGGCRCIVNPYGYPHERGMIGYDPSLTITVGGARFNETA